MALHTRKEKLLEEVFATLGKMRSFGENMHDVSSADRIATFQQMHALSYLENHPATAVGDLGKLCYMSSSSVAQFIDRLQKAGFIQRAHDEKDKRIVRLSISEKGKKELVSMQKKMREKMKNMFSVLSEHDLEEMIRIQKKILTSLKRKDILKK